MHQKSTVLCVALREASPSVLSLASQMNREHLILV